MTPGQYIAAPGPLPVAAHGGRKGYNVVGRRGHSGVLITPGATAVAIWKRSAGERTPGSGTPVGSSPKEIVRQLHSHNPGVDQLIQDS